MARMNDKQRCQSCGMPLGTGFYGTEANSSESAEYCKFCYRRGDFTNPAMSMEQMIDISVKHMVGELKFEEARAREIAMSFIPHLRRWKK